MVRRSDNLRSIALRKYGRWDPLILARIKENNPWLRDPNHLEAGRTLVLPEWKAAQARGGNLP